MHRTIERVKTLEHLTRAHHSTEQTSCVFSEFSIELDIRSAHFLEAIEIGDKRVIIICCFDKLIIVQKANMLKFKDCAMNKAASRQPDLNKHRSSTSWQDSHIFSLGNELLIIINYTSLIKSKE